MPNTALTGAPYPASSDVPNGPTQIRNAVEHLERYTNLRFATLTARDTAIPTPVDGMTTYITNGLLPFIQVYQNGEWLKVWERKPPFGNAFFNGAGNYVFGPTALLSLGSDPATLQGGFAVASTTRLVVPRGGLYLVSAQARVAPTPSTAAAFQLRVVKNSAGVAGGGSTVSQCFTGPAPFNQSLSVPARVVPLADADYLELSVSGPATGEVIPGTGNTWLNATWLGY